MKTLLLALFAVSAFAQATFTISIPGDPGSVSMTISAQAVPSMIAGIENSPAVGTSPSTLTSAVTSTATTFPVAQDTNVIAGMGVCFGTAPSCTEVAFISAVSGLNLTVTRALLGTTAAAYPSGQAFTYIRSGDSGVFIANLIHDAIVPFITAFPGPTIAAANAAIATQQATITSTVAAGFSQTP